MVPVTGVRRRAHATSRRAAGAAYVVGFRGLRRPRRLSLLAGGQFRLLSTPASQPSHRRPVRFAFARTTVADPRRVFTLHTPVSSPRALATVPGLKPGPEGPALSDRRRSRGLSRLPCAHAYARAGASYLDGSQCRQLHSRAASFPLRAFASLDLAWVDGMHTHSMTPWTFTDTLRCKIYKSSRNAARNLRGVISRW